MIRRYESPPKKSSQQGFTRKRAFFTRFRVYLILLRFCAHSSVSRGVSLLGSQVTVEQLVLLLARTSRQP